MEIEKNLPIGFMDSGLGGLSVLKEALRVMPYEDFIYYGDSAHAPYGTKEPEQIRELTFHVVEHQCNFPRIGAITRSFTMLRK